LPYTARAKRVIESTMAEARDLNQSYIDTEHLFLLPINAAAVSAALRLSTAAAGVTLTAHQSALILASGGAG